MGMGVIERGNPTCMPMECDFKTDSQERDTRISLVEEEIGSIECSPSFMPGLAWPDICPHTTPSSCEVCDDPLVYWRTQERWEG